MKTTLYTCLSLLLFSACSEATHSPTPLSSATSSQTNISNVTTGNSSVVALSSSSQKTNFLIINEFISRNKIADNPKPDFLDQAKKYSDWVELYNKGTEPIRLSDYYISDDPQALYTHTLYDTIIPPKGYYVLFATLELAQIDLKGDTTATYQNHVPFKLSYKCGDELFLVRKADSVVVDSVIFAYESDNYTYLASNESFGRLDDGSSVWSPQSIPTPSESNKGRIKTDKDKDRDKNRYDVATCI